MKTVQRFHQAVEFNNSMQLGGFLNFVLLFIFPSVTPYSNASHPPPPFNFCIWTGLVRRWLTDWILPIRNSSDRGLA